MPLTPGTTLGPYSVTAKIGEGGMGEVYRARDTKLDRDVALKVLPPAFTDDPDRLARFEREAKVLASLSHPNIGGIHGLEESGGTKALVLEYIDGPTLADRIAQGPIPVDEALAIAKQICDALEAAHEAGIIHRDLKPANIKLKPDGTVKVLDFGLAKAIQPEPNDASLSQSPTMSLTAAATQMGMVVGTAAYMAPEQAKGLPVDKRADIWAFGAVLFETLTGKKLFEAGDVSEMLASVLIKEPDISGIGTHVPAHIRSVVRRCLVKDPKKRLRDMGDVRLAMEGAFQTASGVRSEPVVAPKVHLLQRRITAIALGLVVLSAGGISVWRSAPSPSESVARFGIQLGSDFSFTDTGDALIAISPAGDQIAYTSESGLSVRPVDQLQSVPVSGVTRDAQNPLFSPNGQEIAFYEDGQLKKVSINGGAPTALCDAERPLGASWGVSDTILFAQRDGIWQVSAQGGQPQLVVSVDEGGRVGYPQMLADDESVLFTRLPEATLSWDDADIVVTSLATGETTVVIEGGRHARYLRTGHLVYARNRTLFGAPFDLEARRPTRGPAPLIEGISTSINARSGAVHYSVAENGSLVYIPEFRGVSEPLELVWVDRQGRVERVGVDPRSYAWGRVSPDGTRLAFSEMGSDSDIYTWNLEQERMTRLTFGVDSADFPLWSPDRSRLVFWSDREGGGLFWKASDGSGEVERLFPNPETIRPYGWSPDGRLLVDKPRGGIALLDLGEDKMVETVLDSGFRESNPAISPDGRWIAYQSDEDVQPQVYVRPFPNVAGGPWQVSTGFGVDPLWSPDGSELFFIAESGFAVAPVETEPTFSSGTPRILFPMSGYPPTPGREYDISPDGNRFLFRRLSSQTSEGGPQMDMVVVLNWHQELLERVPLP